MKYIILLFIIVSTSIRLQADVGDAYRYKATLKLTNNKEITGYFYFATYEKGFDKAKGDFKNYIFSYYHFPIILYKTIKTIKIDSSLTVDFALEGSSISINKNDIVSIKLINQISFPVGSRLKEVNQNEFSIINQKFIDFKSIYNETFHESCSFLLLNWSDKNNLEELKKEISDNIEKLIIKNNEQSILEYISNKRAELIKKKIIIFEYCEP
jgi:hypothetical protein